MMMMNDDNACSRCMMMNDERCSMYHTAAAAMGSSSLVDTLFAFAKEKTKDFDPSHGIEHAEKVYNNAMEIAKGSSSTTIDMNTLITVAILHDVCDHKYKDKSISKEDLRQFIASLASTYQLDTETIMLIIDNISWSKQNKSGYVEPELSPSNQQILAIIRDADRLEAIGAIGIERCIEYTKAFHPNLEDRALIDHVLQHCDEKLLKIIDGITTEKGQSLAKPLHQEIVDYVSLHRQ